MDNQKIFNIICNQKPNPLLLQETKSSFCDDFILDYCKSINCDVAKTFCNNCIDCKKFNEKKYFDFVKFDLYNLSVSKEDVLAAINQFKYSSLESKGNKFFIFKGIELANKYITNLMLRSIEEPNKNTYYIFVSRNTNAVLETILSRCYVYRLDKDLDRSLGILKLNNIDDKYFDFLLEAFFEMDEILNFYNSKSFNNILNFYNNLLTYKNKIPAIKNCLNDFKNLNYFEIEKLFIMFAINNEINIKEKIFLLLNDLKSNPNKTLIFNELLNILKII